MRKRPLIIAACVLALVLLAAGFQTVFTLSRARTWTAASGKPVPDRFMYLLFPRNSSVELVDDGGRWTGRYLDRAVMCSEQELHEGPTVGVWLGDSEPRVSRNRLSPSPTVPNRASLVDAWKKTVASWGKDASDWKSVEITFEPLKDGSHRATLRLEQHNGNAKTFVYRITGDTATPEEWRWFNN